MVAHLAFGAAINTQTIFTFNMKQKIIIRAIAGTWLFIDKPVMSENLGELQRITGGSSDPSDASTYSSVKAAKVAMWRAARKARRNGWRTSKNTFYSAFYEARFYFLQD